MSFSRVNQIEHNVKWDQIDRRAKRCHGLKNDFKYAKSKNVTAIFQKSLSLEKTGPFYIEVFENWSLEYPCNLIEKPTTNGPKVLG